MRHRGRRGGRESRDRDERQGCRGQYGVAGECYLVGQLLDWTDEASAALGPAQELGS